MLLRILKIIVDAVRDFIFGKKVPKTKRYIKPALNGAKEPNRWRKKPKHFRYREKKAERKRAWYECCFSDALLHMTMCYVLLHLILMGYYSFFKSIAAVKNPQTKYVLLAFMYDHLSFVMAVWILILSRNHDTVGRQMRLFNDMFTQQ